MITKLLTLLGISSDFDKIFFLNEYKALSGHRQRTIWTLLTILFFTFLALGFAVGSLGNLKRKMDNPFTNWVDVEVRSGMDAKKVGQIKERYEDPEVKEKLMLNNMTGWVKTYENFGAQKFNPFKPGQDSLIYQLPGRTVDLDDPILVKILEEKNALWYAPGIDTSDLSTLEECDIIISAAMMQRLGYASPDSIGMVCLPNELGMPLFVRVAAVVKELPALCYFIYSPKLYNILHIKRDGTMKCNDLIVKNSPGNNIFHLLTDSESNVQHISEKAGVFFSSGKPTVETTESFRASSKSWYHCRVAFMPAEAPAIDTFLQFVDQVRMEIPVAEYSFIECGSKNCRNADEADFHYLAFNFERLEMVRTFSNELRDTFDVQVDMSQVAAKENFSLVSKLTAAISFILLGFGVLSIVLFVSNLLRTHLFEVRSNLGTFQAFGLNKRLLIRNYLKIIFSFLIIAIVSAFALAVVVDVVENYVAGPEESRFDVFSVWVLAAVLVLIAVSLYLSVRSISHILGDTPGNLIYER